MGGTRRVRLARWGEPIVVLATAGLTAVVLIALIRPFHVGPVGYDTAASVVYFEHLIQGVRLSAPVGATPKPALTLIDGALWWFTHDWRAIAIVTIVVDAFAVGFATVLAGRLGGPVAAGFAALAFLGSWDLVSDTTIAYATPLALAGLLLAGLALTRPQPRFGVAGLGLLLAALARFEAITLVVPMSAGLAISWARARQRGERPSWMPGALALLAPVLTVPLMALHDLLIAGDPLYWLKVPGQFSAAFASSVLDPAALAAFAVTHYGATLPTLGLAAVGIVWLLRRGQTTIAVGLGGLALGVLGFLFVLAARGTYVSSRYFYLADLAILFAAAVGAGGLVSAAGRGLRGRIRRFPAPGPRLRLGGLVIVGVLIAGVAAQPITPLDAGLSHSVRLTVQTYWNADKVATVIDQRADGSVSGSFLVPGLLVPRLALSTGRPMDAFTSIRVDPPLQLPPAAILVYHDRGTDRPVDAFRTIERPRRFRVADRCLVPVIVQPLAGFWLYRVSGC